MKRISQILPAVLFTALLSNPGVAQQATENPNPPAKGELKLYGRLQTIAFGQYVNDNFANKVRLYLYLKQARFGVSTYYDDVKFDFQAAFGGEEEIKAPSPGISLSMLDLSADILLCESMHIKVGQFKVPYGREGLTNEGYIQFNDLSIQYLATRVGRDVGVAAYGSSGNFTAAFGVFTGGGRDVPIRYIPQDLGIPMLVVRAGINNGLDEDILTLKQTNYNPKEGFAIYANALYTKDSKIGHSTALNVKTSDKSLLLNSNWNPFINTRPFDKGDFWQAGVDAAFRTSLSEMMFVSGEAEVNYGAYKNTYGNINVLGGRAQAGIYKQPLELAFRYAFIRPSPQFAYVASTGTAYNIVDGKLIHELTLGMTYYIKGDRLKIGIDLPILIGVPVLTEPNLGAYVLTEQPDQTTIIAPPTNAKIDRQNVVEARMQLQYGF